ncbi:transglycosylase SLT domain-containing protein [Myxococcota bacterium]|nr:transglycosylase SLT domain-containing protein [Myxococcota bacterium]MBU1536369.1 transglycosylase SLT domain-containing protein [Myxococcota bacterium]
MCQTPAKTRSIPVTIWLPMAIFALFSLLVTSFVLTRPRVSFAASFQTFDPAPFSLTTRDLPKSKKADEKPAAASVAVPKPLIAGDRLYITRFSRYKAGDMNLTRGVEKYHQGDYPGALSMLAKSTTPQAAWWILKTHYKNKDFSAIIKLVPSLTKSLFLLREDLVFLQMKSYLEKGDKDNALILSRLLLKGPRRLEALKIQARILFEKKDTVSEEKLLKTLVGMKEIPPRDRVEAILRLLEIPRTKKERRGLLEQAWTMTLRSSIITRLNAYAKKWFKMNMLRLASCRGIVERGALLNRRNFHKKASQLLGRKIRCPRPLKCKKDFYLARSLFFLKQYKRAAPSIGRAVITCEKTPLVELRVKAKYLAGKIAFARGRYKTAIKAFGRVAREHPDHSYGDDGLYRLALTYRKMKNEKAFHRTLAAITRSHTSGDKFPDALWLPILSHLEKSRWAKASTALKKARSLITPTPPLENWGRILYWQGRVAHIMGQNTKAMTHYKECVAMAPLTYHALLSLNRLDELQKGLPQTILKAVLSKNAPGTLPWSVLTHPYFATDSFARFVELARVGDEPLALAALHTLKSPLPFKPGKISHRPFFKGVAMILHLSGFYRQSYFLMGRVLMDHAHSWPTNDTRILWQMAYPLLHTGAIKSVALKTRVEETVLMGLVREESGFSHKARSTAGALGLAQIMPKTARHIAKKFHIPYRNTGDLQRPATNLLIAGSYLKLLKKMFGGKRLLYVGAYNCGEGAMKRWRKADSKVPLDLFVEKMRVIETRNYIKKVISSMFVYHLLSGKKDFPVLSL